MTKHPPNAASIAGWTGRSGAWRCLRSLVCACLAAFVALLPLAAPAQSPDPITAVLEACTLPTASLQHRFAMLSDAGWRTADDTPAVRELYALRMAARFPKFFDDVTEATVADLRKRLDTAPLLTLPPGQVLTIADLPEQMVPGKFFEPILTQTEQFAIVQLRITTRKEIDSSSDNGFLMCEISFTSPLGDHLQQLVQRRAPLDTGPPSDPAKSELFHFYSRPETARTDDGLLRLVVFDVLPASTFHTLATRAGFQTRLATQLSTRTGFFPLEVSP